jgi:hypothetical protein
MTPITDTKVEVAKNIATSLHMGLQLELGEGL